MKTFFLYYIIFFSFVVCAQTTSKDNLESEFYSEAIRDSIFENVIKITDNNIASNKVDYLFNIAIPKSIKIPIIFVQAKVPLNLLPTIFPEFSKIIVISPNWTYYSRISNKNLPKENTRSEPMASSIIYEFNREKGKIRKDSIVMMGDFPKMKFKKANKLKNNKIEVYYVENYGSICCPRDQQWDIKPTREEFITFFEKENNVKIANTYQEIIGKEGEALYYYTLNGLSDTLKLKFILQRDFYRIANRELKDIQISPIIYTPFIIETNEKRKKI